MVGARKQLQKFVEDQGLTSSELARRLGCSQSHAWRILFESAGPGLRTAAAIERVTGIKASEWAADEREAVR